MLVCGRIKKKILDNVVKNLIALFQENDKREMCIYIYIYILNITVISKYRYELCYRLNKKKIFNIIKTILFLENYMVLLLNLMWQVSLETF